MSYQDKLQARRAQAQQNIAAAKQRAYDTAEQRYNTWDANTTAEMAALEAQRRQQAIAGVQSGAQKIRARVPEPRATEAIRTVLKDPRMAARAQSYMAETDAMVNDVYNQNVNQAYANYEAEKARVTNNIKSGVATAAQANPRLFEHILSQY